MTFKHSLAMALDPVKLFTRATSHTPDAWQARLLRSNAPRVLLNCFRQCGKSTVVASIALHSALYAAPSLVLALSPSLRQSQELFRKVQHQYRALGRPVAAVSETTTHLELVSGSRIVCLPESEETIRGYSGVTLLIIDEAARVADDVYGAVVPMLGTSHGRLIGLSTPWGKLGWWYEAWTNGGARWERYEVPITIAEVARRVDPQVLEDARLRGDWWYGQEYECRFGERADAAFDFALVQRAITPTLEAFDDVLPVVDDWR